MKKEKLRGLYIIEEKYHTRMKSMHNYGYHSEEEDVRRELGSGRSLRVPNSMTLDWPLR